MKRSILFKTMGVPVIILILCSMSQRLQGAEVLLKDTLPANDATYRVDSNTITYILGGQIEKVLEAEIAKTSGDIFFELANKEDGKFKIALIQSSRTIDIWPYMSNRMLFVGKKFYPVVFDYDQTFATSDRGDEILKKSSESPHFMYRIALTLHHYFFFAIFNRQGYVIETGYDGLRKR